LDLQSLGEAAFQAAQGGGIGVFDGGADEFVEQGQRVVQARLRHITGAGLHAFDDKASLTSVDRCAPLAAGLLLWRSTGP
jgi:hypothetical protein